MQTTENEAVTVDTATQDTTQHTEVSDDSVTDDQLVEMLSDKTDNLTGEPGSEDELSEFDGESAQTAEADLESLTEEQLEQLAEQMNSRGAGRIAQLIRERKEL